MEREIFFLVLYFGFPFVFVVFKFFFLMAINVLNFGFVGLNVN